MSWRAIGAVAVVWLAARALQDLVREFVVGWVFVNADWSEFDDELVDFGDEDFE